MPRRRAPTVRGAHHARHESPLFRELMRTHQAVGSTFVRCVGEPAGRLALMPLLAAFPGRFGTNELARRLGVDPAAITRQLKELEAEGLVTRSAHSTDRRRTTVALTRAGMEVSRGIHGYGRAYEQALAAEVSKRDVESAIRVLQAMRRVVLRSVNQDEDDEP